MLTESKMGGMKEMGVFYDHCLKSLYPPDSCGTYCNAHTCVQPLPTILFDGSPGGCTAHPPISLADSLCVVGRAAAQMPGTTAISRRCSNRVATKGAPTAAPAHPSPTPAPLAAR